MDARIALGLCLLLLPLAPVAGGHAGQTVADHPCPDLSTVWGHGHAAAGDDVFLWLDTHEETVHGSTGGAYWSAPAGDNRTFPLLLDPPVAFPTALDPNGTIRIDVAGRAESATGPVLPGPVQTVIDVVLGTDQVPAEAKEILRSLRYTGLQNVGPADVTLQADLVSGGTVVATGQATGVNTQPDGALAVPPSPSSVNETLPDLPRDSPIDPPPVHTPGDRATFQATFELTPTLAMLPPGEPVFLSLTRAEPLAWDLLLGGEDGLSMDLPIVDHPFGPLCPDWVVPPLNATVDAPSKATAAPGDAVTFTISLENPARIAQDVRFTFSGGDYGVVRGVVEDAVDGLVTVDAYEEKVVSGSYQVAENAVEATYRLTLQFTDNNTTIGHVTEVVVAHPVSEPSPSPTPSPSPSLAPSGEGEGAGGASSEGQAGPAAAERFDAGDAGGDSPAAGVLAAAAAVAIGFAAAWRRR